MILVCNDDGIHSEGLRALRDQLANLDEVVVVAPCWDLLSLMQFDWP